MVLPAMHVAHNAHNVKLAFVSQLTNSVLAPATKRGVQLKNQLRAPSSAAMHSDTGFPSRKARMTDLSSGSWLDKSLCAISVAHLARAAVGSDAGVHTNQGRRRGDGLD